MEVRALWETMSNPDRLDWGIWVLLKIFKGYEPLFCGIRNSDKSDILEVRHKDLEQKHNMHIFK